MVDLIVQVNDYFTKSVLSSYSIQDVLTDPGLFMWSQSSEGCKTYLQPIILQEPEFSSKRIPKGVHVTQPSRLERLSPRDFWRAGTWQVSRCFPGREKKVGTFQAEESAETETGGNAEDTYLGKNEKFCGWSIGHMVRGKKMSLEKEMKTFIISGLENYGIFYLGAVECHTTESILNLLLHLIKKYW